MYVLSISSLSEVKMVLPLGLTQYFRWKLLLLSFSAKHNLPTSRSPPPYLCPFLFLPAGLFVQTVITLFSTRVFFKATTAAAIRYWTLQSAFFLIHTCTDTSGRETLHAVTRVRMHIRLTLLYIHAHTSAHSYHCFRHPRNELSFPINPVIRVQTQKIICTSCAI